MTHEAYHDFVQHSDHWLEPCGLYGAADAEDGEDGIGAQFCQSRLVLPDAREEVVQQNTVHSLSPGVRFLSQLVHEGDYLVLHANCIAIGSRLAIFRISVLLHTTHTLLSIAFLQA